MENNLKVMNTLHRSELMGVTMKIKQILVAIALATATLSAQATPATSYYVYDEAGHVIGEYDANGNPIQEHIYLGDRPVAVVQNGNAATLDYVTTDQLNTPRAVTDSSQTVDWSWSSDPFGNDQPTGSLTYNLRFPGQYYDAETGHNYNYYRDYDPGTGRYIESDPIGVFVGVNTYAYSSANSVTRADPLGTTDYQYYPHNYYNNNPNVNATTECDDPYIIIVYFIPGRSDPCTDDCTTVHEQVHIKDLESLGSGYCPPGTKGQLIAFPHGDEFEWYESEVRAYTAEINCLEKKLKSLPCDDKCKADIQATIDSDKGFRNQAHVNADGTNYSGP